MEGNRITLPKRPMALTQNNVHGIIYAVVLSLMRARSLWARRLNWRLHDGSEVHAVHPDNLKNGDQAAVRFLERQFKF